MFPYFYPTVMPQYCPSVCPSVAFRYRDHICWNTSKIISPPNSDKIVMWRFLRNRRLLLCLHRIFSALIYWAHRAVVLAIAWHLVFISIWFTKHTEATIETSIKVGRTMINVKFYNNSLETERKCSENVQCRVKTHRLVLCSRLHPTVAKLSLMTPIS